MSDKLICDFCGKNVDQVEKIFSAENAISVMSVSLPAPQYSTKNFYAKLKKSSKEVSVYLSR